MRTITSAQNPKMKNWRKLLSKKGRDQAGAYLIEGVRLIQEAIRSDRTVIQSLIFSDERRGTAEAWREEIAAKEEAQQRKIEQVLVPSSLINRLTDTKTPQGMLAVLEKNDVKAAIDELESRLRQTSALLLLLDAVREPGNVGAIIRTADAAGVDAVIVGKGSADLYNPKVIRAAMGSSFHLPLVEAELEPWMAELKKSGYRIVATALDRSDRYDRVSYRGRVACMMGNEAHGISPEIMSKADERVKIPIYGKAESLNVATAAGVLLYEAQRQRQEDFGTMN